MSRRGLDCRIHLPQFPGVKCPVPCNRYTAMLALTLPSVEVLFVCVVECSRCVMVCDVSTNKGIVMPQVGKKKFPYTEAGMKDAKMAAKKMGKKMVVAPKKKKKK